jgi:hypothetical protein
LNDTSVSILAPILVIQDDANRFPNWERCKFDGSYRCEQKC